MILNHTRGQCRLWVWLCLLAACALPVWGQPVPPVNDNFTNAIVISGPSGSLVGDNTFATTEFFEPYCFDGLASVWYKWTSPGNGTIVFDTVGGFFLDTTLAAYTGSSITNLVQLDCNDYFDLFNYGFGPSLISFPAQAGVDYYIAVDGWAGDEGLFVLNWFGLTNVAPPIIGTNQIQFASTLFTVNENVPGFATIDVVYSGGAAGPVTVDYATSDGTAIDGIDYFGQSGTLTFNLGETNQSFQIPIMDNPFPNSNKTVNLLLLNVTGGATLGSVSNSALLIIDDETVPPVSTAGQFNFALSTFIISDLTYGGPNYRDLDGALITVTRTGGATGRVLVDYTTVDYTNIFYTNIFYLTNYNGLAIPNYEYIPTSGTLVFDDYQMSAQFIVPILGSLYSNGLINIDLALSNPRPAPEEEAMRPGVIAPTLGALSTAQIQIEKRSWLPTTAYYFDENHYRVDEYDRGFYVTITGPRGLVGFRTFARSFGADLMPGSDYADGANFNDPNPAFTDGHGPIVSQADYNSGDIILNHQGGRETFYMQILNDDNVPEFNEDIYCVLFRVPNNPPVAAYPYNTTTTTILYDDQPAGALDRNWNPYGLHNTSPPFNPTPGANNTVNGVAVQADQKTIIGGDFTAFNTIPRNHVARINQDGSLDLTFEPGTGANGTVTAVGVYPTNSVLPNLIGKVLIAGTFTSYNGDSRNGIARLNADGSLDTTFHPGDGANTPIRAIIPMDDGKVLIGGEFTMVNGVPRNRVARLNEDGKVDLSFDPGVGADAPVWALAVDNSPSPLQITATRLGTDLNFAPEFRTNINTLASSGTITLNFRPGCEPDSLKVYYGSGLIYDSGLTNEYHGGPCFTNLAPTPINRVIRYGPGAFTDLTFVVNEGGGPPVQQWEFDATIENQVAGKRVIVGGEFTVFDGAVRNGVARLNSYGALDLTFDPGSGVDGPVYAVACQKDLKVIIGGAFNDLDFRVRNSIARLNADGSVDTGYDPNYGFNNPVYCITLDPDGKALVGGSFTSYDGVRRIGMARLMTNAVLDTGFMDTAYNQFAGLINSFSFQAPNFVNSIALETNGNIMIGGSFTNIGGNSMLPYFHRVYPEFYYISGTTNFPATTRQDKVPRYNVARLIGGYTYGPGVAELSFPEYSVNENDGLLNVTLNRVDGRLGTLIGYVMTSNRVAQAGVDYTYSKTEVDWPEFAYVAPISVGYIGPRYFQIPILDNSLIDGNRILDLLLVDPQGSITLSGEVIPLGGARARIRTPLTIVDNDFPKGVLTFSSPTYFVNENEAYATVNVIRTNGSDGQVTVDYFTLDGTARAGSDYTRKTNTLSFSSGVTNAIIQIPILNDTSVELDETFSIILTNATGGAKLPGGSPVSYEVATVTIIDDDFAAGRLNFAATNFTVMENAGYGTVTVTRSGGNSGSIAVDVSASAGTAVNGVDFTAITTNLHWNSGDSSPKSFTVPVINNSLVDGARTINLQMLNPSTNGLLGNIPVSTLTIVDDDSYGKLSFSQGFYEANENGTNVVITVVRSGGLSGTVSVSYTNLGGSAVPGLDYLLIPGTLTLGPGVSSATFSIQLINNSLTDGDRTVILGLYNLVGATNGLFMTATNLIIDDEMVNRPAGSLDTEFNALTGANKPVYALSLQPDGKLLAAGDFTTIQNVTRHRLGRILNDGSLDPTFNVGDGPNRSVRAMALQSDGSILLGGFFTLIHGTNRNHIARLTSDGSLDIAFDPGSGTDNPVYAIALAPDGRVLIGGTFTTFNGIGRRNIAMLNTNGTLDVTFNPGLGANGTVYAVAIQPDGKVVLGGDFTLVNNVSRPRIARLNSDGSVDMTFNPQLGADATVRAIAIQPDGMVLIGGSFASYNGTSRSYLARLDTNGGLDPAFLDGESAADNAVYSIALQPDGKIIVVGDFTTFNNVTRNRITRLYPNGRTDPTINFGTGANSFINAVVIQPDRKLVIGGGFTTFNGEPRAYLARLHGGSIDGFGAVEFMSASYSVTESTTNAMITVRRIGGTTGDVSVDFFTAADSARPSINYLETSGRLFFREGEVIQSFSVPIINYPFVEEPKTVDLFLTNILGGVAFGGQPTATLTILSDNSVISFLTTDFSIYEYASSGAALITVVRSGATNTTVSIDFYTRDGTAINGLDYIGLRDSLTFGPGDTVKTFTIPIMNDNGQVQPNRTVYLALTNATADATLGIQNATLTIVDGDSASGELNFSLPNYQVNEYETNFAVTIVRSLGSVGIISVDYATTDGSAHFGADYIGASGTLSFADGEMVKTFNIPILQNDLNKTNSTVILTLSNPRGGATLGATKTAILTILNTPLENGSFSFIATNFSTVEGSLMATVTVARSFGFSSDVSVSCRTLDGTASNVLDYVAATNVLTWTNGDRAAKSFTIGIINDNLVEGPEYFGIQLFNPTGGATLGARTNATVAIIDDDFGAGFLSFKAAAYTWPENGTNAIIEVIRTYGDTGVVTVAYSTAPGSAVPYIHYTNVTGILTFAPGETNKSFLVPIVDRPVVEVDKTVLLTLSNPTGGASISNQITSAVLTIVENQQEAGSIDAGFGALGADGQVNVIVFQTNNNKLLVGGDFTGFNNMPRARLARFNPNGSLDASFDVGTAFNHPVHAIAMQPDGRALIGGSFINAYNSSNSYLVRVNADATMDTNFFAGTHGVDNLVEAIALQNDGKIVIGGWFSAINRTNRNYFARLNANGEIDMTFNPSAGASDAVRAIIVQNDGKILIAGDFQYVNGVQRSRIARLQPDGTLDATFNPGTGADGSISSMVLDITGQIVIGGLFQNYNGVARAGVARITATGQLDPSFDPGTGADEFVSALAVQPDGKVLVGGGFTSFNGLPHHRLTRLNINGSGDTSINIGSGADNYVSTIAIQPDRKIVIGGGFTAFDDVPRYRIARLNGGDNEGEGSLVFTATNYAVAENGTNITITVRRHIGTTNTITVNYSTMDGTAQAGIHYLPTNGTLTFISGETVQTFQVSVLDDFVINPDRVLNLVLSNPVGVLTGTDQVVLGDPSTATLTIVNDDCSLGFSSSAYSVSENGQFATITVERLGSSIGTVSVDFATSDNTATTGLDYLPAKGTLTFLDGQTNATFTVMIQDDILVEGNELVNLNLSNPTNAILGNSAATLTIVDDEYSAGQIGFTLANYPVSERGGHAVVSVTRAGGSSGAASVRFATSNGSAAAGLDYIATNGLLVFADGEATKSFFVTIIDDTLVEGAETFNVTLSNPTGGTIGVGAATVTILADEATFNFSQPFYTYYESNGFARVTVTRSTNGTGPVSVSFMTSNQTALAGSDYFATNGTITWAVGDYAPKDILIPLINDNIGEPIETFSVILLSPVGEAVLGAVNPCIVQILDDDISFSFSQTDYSISETGRVATVTVVRTGLSNGVASVYFATSDGTATAGSDYTFTSVQLNFADGQITTNVSIPIIDDTIAEGNEYFFVNLASPSPNASVGPPAVAKVTIIDNEDVFTLSTNSYVIMEGNTNAEIVVVRSGNPGPNPVVINYATTNITAVPGVNYSNVSGVLIFGFNNGLPETQKSFFVPIIDDNTAEGDVTVGIKIWANNAGNAGLMAPTNAILTILDNDMSVGFDSASYSLIESTTNLVIPVTRSGAISNTLRVSYATSNGTATAGSDYAAVSGTLTFLPGVTNLNVVVPIFDDLKIEGNESFTVRLSNPSLTNVTFRGGGITTVTIIDNDNSKIIPAGSAFVAESISVNGIIDAGETVTLNLGLRNIGNVDTTNLMATLLVTNGVTAPNPTQRSYGVVVAGGSVVSRSFAFTAAGANGSQVVVTLRLQDIDAGSNWTNNLGTITYTFVIGRAGYTFANAAPILILDNTNASPYPSTILVSNVVGNVSKVTLAISNLSHAFPSDIDMLLVSPSGRAMVPMSDAGGGNEIFSVNLVFDDAATGYLPFNGQIVSGTYKPTNYVETPYGIPSIDWFPAPAPARPWYNSLSDLTNGNPNGAWSLYIVDDTGGEAGNIAGGWSLSFTTSDSGTNSADLAVTGAEDFDPILLGGNLVYTLGVTNYGPSSAPAVYVTNVLGANVQFVACSGTYTNIGNLVIANLGTLASGSGRQITLAVRPMDTTPVNLHVQAASTQTDLYPDNNSLDLVTAVVSTPALYCNVKGPGYMTFSWIDAGGGFVMESTGSLTPPVHWVPVPGTPTPSGALLTVTIPTSGTNQFFRLRQP